MAETTSLNTTMRAKYVGKARRHVTLTLMVMLALGLTAVNCGPAAAPGQSSGQAAAPQASKEPLKIGAVISMTGSLASFGADALPAVQLFVDETNAKGGVNGRPLQLVHVDDESKPELALSAAKRLIQQEKVLGIVGPLATGPAVAISSTVNEGETPTLSCRCEIGPFTPYEFTTFPFNGMNHQLGEFAKKRGIREIGILTTAGATAEVIKRLVVPDLENNEGLKVVGFESWQPTDTDLTPQLAKMRGQGLRLIYVAASGAPAALAAKNFKQMEYPGLYWTFPGNANEAFINLIGEASDVINTIGTKVLIYQQLPDSDPFKAGLVNFATKYKAKTGKEPGTYAAFFWNNMLSLTDAIQKAGDDRQKIRAALESQAGLRMLDGVLTRSEKEHNGMTPEWVDLKIDGATKKFVVPK